MARFRIKFSRFSYSFLFFYKKETSQEKNSILRYEQINILIELDSDVEVYRFRQYFWKLNQEE